MSKVLGDTLAQEATLPASDSESAHGDRARTLEPGQTHLGDYLLSRRLGAGATGEVFAAHHVDADADDGELLALKVLSETAATRLVRFKREFRALADVDHPNLVALRELVVPEQGPPFFTMELIDGLSFVRWVRGEATKGALPDLERLTGALVQLVEAVEHLHARGFVHRDLKPANVLVTAAGRVVVLDFGLVTEAREPDVAGLTHEGQLLGTPRYMAPEQVLGTNIGPRADLYAIGVMLYECLRGEPPHTGSIMQLFVGKQEEDAPDPGAIVPAALRFLCRKLLAKDPQQRPDTTEVLAELQLGRRRVASPSVPVIPFVGRERELAVFQRVFDRVEQGGALVVMHLRGPSGHGKSRLSQRACQQLRGRGALLLEGRCRQQESVPYKGLDAVIDRLSAHLRALPEQDRDALRPPDDDVLTRLFPVLEQLWPATPVRVMGPAELRKLGAHSLTQLLTRIGEILPIVIHVDDLQWADEDTLSLLEDIAGQTSIRALLLLSYRSQAPQAFLEELLASERLSGIGHERIELGPLSFSHARELATRLLESREQPNLRSLATRAEAIAMRAQGSPFFIAQLSLEAGPRSLSDDDTDLDLDLDLLVSRRLSELDAHARRLLEVVAVFGGPLAEDLALELSDGAPAHSIDELCERALLLRARFEYEVRVELADERMREAAIAGLGASERRELHWRLGHGLRARCEPEPRDAELFMIAEHLDAGLEGRRAQLDESERRELLELQQLAGERSLELGAWAAARRHLRCASSLLAPGSETTHQPRERVELGFALAQAEFALDPDHGLELCRALMARELDARTRSELLDWHNSRLMLVGAWEQGVAPAVRAAEQLGFRVPRMSFPRSLLSYALGWRALQRSGLLEGEVPLVRDSHAHALMSVVGTLAQTPIFVDLELSIWAYGEYGQLLRRHGAHESMGVVLVRWAMSAVAIGRSEQARRMATLVTRDLSSPRTPVAVGYSVKAWLPLLLAILYPITASRPQMLAYYRDVRKVAPQAVVEISAGICSLGLFAATPLPELVALIESARGPSGDWEVTYARGFFTPFIELMHALITGDTPEFAGEQPDINPFSRGLLRAFHSFAAVALGDYEGARAHIEHVPSDYARSFGPIPVAPLFACAGVIAMLEQGGSPWRRRAALRRHRAAARKWARHCPENYGAAVELIDAELAAARGRWQRAMEGYERAIAQASDNGVELLAGLAAHRMGRLALRRGQRVVASGAFTAAIAAHRGWGARAAVLAVEAETIAAGLRR